MLFTPQQKSEIENIVRNLIAHGIVDKKVGDTPLEAYDLVNKKYVDSKTAFSLTDLSSNIIGTVYTNTSGFPQLHIVSIDINGAAGAGTGASATVNFNVNGSLADEAYLNMTNGAISSSIYVEEIMTLVAVVPSGQTYQITKATTGNGSVGSIVTWKAINL